MNNCRLRPLALVAWVTFLGAAAPYLTANEQAPVAASLQYFDLPSQPLQVGLVEFALQSNSSVVADQRLLEGYRTTPVVGPLTAETALTLLLASTELFFTYLPASNAYVIKPKPARAFTPAAEPVSVTQSDAIDELVVTGSRYPFRYNTVTNTHVHGGVSYFDSSRFLSVLPQALIADTQAESLDDVLKYTSGVLPGDGLADTNDDARIRGFARHALYSDGFRMDANTGVRVMPANVERIEIVKGPATLRYGQGEPGGVINVVRKKPLQESFTRISAGGGSGGHGFFELDTNAELAALPSVQMRMVAAVDKQDEFAELSDIQQQLVSPSLSWQPNDNTLIEAGFEYQYSSQVISRDITVVNSLGDEFGGASLSDIMAQAGPSFTAHSNRFSLEGSHYFSPLWRGHGKINLQKEYRYGIRTTADVLWDSDLLIHPEELGSDSAVFLVGGQVAIPILLQWQPPDWEMHLGTVRGLYDEEAESQAASMAVDIQGTVHWGSTTHHVLIGVDGHEHRVDQRFVIEARELLQEQTWADSQYEQALVDVVNALVVSKNVGEGYYEDSVQTFESLDLGLFAQDTIELSDQWVISLGTRYSTVTGDLHSSIDGDRTELPSVWRWSSQAGVVYRLNDNHSLFSNYTEAFRVNRAIDEQRGHVLEPELSRQVELGLKSLMYGGRVMAGVAIYDIEKNNIIETLREESYRTIQAPYSQHVQGVDADVSMQVSDRLNLVGALSFLRPEILTGDYAGLTPAMTAEQSASVFGLYDINSALSVHGGLKYVSDRFADRANDWVYSAYTTLDIGFELQLPLLGDHAQLRGSVNNVLDQIYNTATIFGVRENTAAGRTFILSVDVNF